MTAQEVACCAHLRVEYDPIHTEGGLTRSRWRCRLCEKEFHPARAALAASEPTPGGDRERRRHALTIRGFAEALRLTLTEAETSPLGPPNPLRAPVALIVERMQGAAAELESPVAAASEGAGEGRDTAMARWEEETTQGAEVTYTPAPPAAQPPEGGGKAVALLPCPLCGAPAAFQVDDEAVACTMCDTIGPSLPSKAQAVAAWNRRPAPPAAAPALCRYCGHDPVANAEGVVCGACFDGARVEREGRAPIAGEAGAYHLAAPPPEPEGVDHPSRRAARWWGLLTAASAYINARDVVLGPNLDDVTQEDEDAEAVAWQELRDAVARMEAAPPEPEADSPPDEERYVYMGGMRVPVKSGDEDAPPEPAVQPEPVPTHRRVEGTETEGEKRRRFRRAYALRWLDDLGTIATRKNPVSFHFEDDPKSFESIMDYCRRVREVIEEFEGEANDLEARAAAPPEDRWRALLRQPFLGLYLDGRNEHGTHVLELGLSSIGSLSGSVVEDLEDQENGLAERVFRDAEAAGFTDGAAVVATFSVTLDSEHSYAEYEGVDAVLTAAFYGRPDEQPNAYRRPLPPPPAGLAQEGE